MKRAALYCRVSTSEQEENYSIPMQKEKLINYCKAKSWIIGNIFIDPAYSGSNLNRPAIQQLISDIKNFDIILVYRLDRLSRSQKDTLYLIEDVFLKNSVDFASLSESFDTSTPFGRATIGMLSVFAQLERETIKERFQDGREGRAKIGLFHGGGFAPIGYDYIDGKLIINEYEAMQIKEIFDLYLAGKGIRQICQIMENKRYKHKHGSWRNTITVVHVIDNPLYTGKVRFASKEFQGQQDPIIDEKTFNIAQELRGNRKELHKRVYEYTTLLGGFLYCGCCGARYTGYNIANKKKNINYQYYKCYSRLKSWPSMAKDNTCRNQTWRRDELDAIITQKVLSLSKEKIISRKKKKEDTGERHNKTIEKKIEKIEKKIEKLLELYSTDGLSIIEISNKIKILYEEKQILSQNLQQIIPKEIVKLSNSIIFSLVENWEEKSLQEKRLVFEYLINKIILTGKSFEIQWKSI